VKLTIDLHLMSRSRTRGAIPLLPNTSSKRGSQLKKKAQGQLYLYLTILYLGLPSDVLLYVPLLNIKLRSTILAVRRTTSADFARWLCCFYISRKDDCRQLRIISYIYHGTKCHDLSLINKNVTLISEVFAASMLTLLMLGNL
jgi:hypothetical protein